MKHLIKIAMCTVCCAMLFGCGKEMEPVEETVTLVTPPTSDAIANQSIEDSAKNFIKESEQTSEDVVLTSSEVGTEVVTTAEMLTTSANVTEATKETLAQSLTQQTTGATEATTQPVQPTATQQIETSTQAATQPVPTEPITEAPTQPVETEVPTETLVLQVVPIEIPAEETQSPTEPETQPQNVVEPTTEVVTEVVTEAAPLSELELRIVNDVWVYSAYIQKVIGLVNVERRNNGLPMLQYDINLSKVATHRCIENIDNNMFSHTRPDGSPCFTLYPVYGVEYEAAAENIAAGQITPEEVVASWMNSPMHRDNILGNYTYVGVGISADASGCLYWAQCFKR